MTSNSTLAMILGGFFNSKKFIGVLKPLLIMANIDLKFLCSFQKNDYAKVFLAIGDEPEKFICIKVSEEDTTSTIMLDKSTAIKFAKTLRTEINKIQS